jgi:hypothetical protein
MDWCASHSSSSVSYMRVRRYGMMLEGQQGVEGVAGHMSASRMNPCPRSVLPRQKDTVRPAAFARAPRTQGGLAMRSYVRV